MDALGFEYANRLTEKDIREKLRQQQALEALFEKREK